MAQERLAKVPRAGESALTRDILQHKNQISRPRPDLSGLFHVPDERNSNVLTERHICSRLSHPNLR